VAFKNNVQPSNKRSQKWCVDTFLRIAFERAVEPSRWGVVLGLFYYLIKQTKWGVFFNHVPRE
jgi:hypothetical protein